MKKKSWMSRVGIVVISAFLVELISVLQYQRVRKIMLEDMAVRSNIVVGRMVSEIEHALEMTEATMAENMWEVKRCLANPDSVSTALVHLIDENPHVIGGCMAFVPDYYPSEGVLYEPYIFKKDGGFVLQQLGGPGHDYTQHEAFRRVLATDKTVWSDPYIYGPDSLELTTYSYPVHDREGRLAAVCGLDMDLSWLGDTLNANQHFRSSFGLLLNQKGELVAYPPQKRTPWEQVQKVMDILEGKESASGHPEFSFEKGVMDRPPYWQVVQVYNTDDLYARLRAMRRQQLLMILLGLAILAFMINRYARSESKLRESSEQQARLGGELAIARNIQQQMLPKTFPSYVYGSLEPAMEVGGDLFDFFSRDGKLFFCIGDVSGKGVPSAMLMSVAHSVFRMISGKVNSPAEILQVMNGELCRGNENNMFITFLVGCLDMHTGELSYANAGHDKPFLLSGEVSQLDTIPNIPLGVFPDFFFREQRCLLERGTTLVLYTDGLTEAKNPGRKQFGLAGVREVLQRCLQKGDVTPVRLVSALGGAAHSFAGSAPQSDDLTMLAIRFEP